MDFVRVKLKRKSRLEAKAAFYGGERCGVRRHSGHYAQLREANTLRQLFSSP
ncbi:hypothetical protein [Ottowia thiooxydans]|uniref:hypothetical protein n=1 Tax=Ottowia thiooxydans TaxID=219182 RepID=UPI0012EC679E|nr:hypothetical protein [Ottowia thiooxydans]